MRTRDFAAFLLAALLAVTAPWWIWLGVVDVLTHALRRF